MPSITSFRDLLVWRKSVDLAVKCHLVAELEAEALIQDAAEVGRMINGLVRSLDRAR